MVVDEQALRDAVVAIASTPGLVMDVNDLVEDVFLLAYAFPDEGEFRSAVAATRRAITQLAAGKVGFSRLKYEFEDWRSYHYQHRVAQCVRATCRIMFRVLTDGVEVKGFGHRHIPADFYGRMSASRDPNA